MTEQRTAVLAGVRDRIGGRQNTSALDIGSWAMALLALSVLIPTMEAVAGNEAFFAAHGVGVVAWLVAVLLIVTAAWMALIGLASLALRLPPTQSDAVITLSTFAVAWFAMGNIIVRTLMSGIPGLGWLLGAIAAAAVALAARRWGAGRVLLGCALAAALLPGVTAAFASQAIQRPVLAFDTAAKRPSIAWIISDELQYPLVLDPQGKVRPEFVNLARLQQDSTTYTRSYATANYTDFAVPAMMNGVADVSAVDDTNRMRASLGFIPGLASQYAIVMQSPIYSFSCDDPSCVTADQVIQADRGSVPDRLGAVLADTAAVAGRTLAPPYAELFPSLDGKWRDFWEGGDEFGSSAPGNTVDAAIAKWKAASAAGAPTFTFWHSIRTHAPWAVDRTGREIYPPRLPVVEGAHMVGTDRTGLMRSAELGSMERRLYANAAFDFDRQLGRFIDALKAAGAYDDTMIVLTADHGAGITYTGDRRMGDNLEQRWTEVAHVPLMVKGPGQTAPKVVTEPRSNGQIARTIVEQAGATPGPDLPLAPSLDTPLSVAPVFSTVAGGKATPWDYQGRPQPDPWTPDDVSPPDPRHPFAIGMDLRLLGQPVPAGYSQSESQIQALPGRSDQVLLVARGRAATCDDRATAGLVSTGGTTGKDTVVGSVLWEARDRPDGRWGWAIVPKAASADYVTWCRSDSAG